MTDFSTTVSIDVAASIEAVWDALTDPAIIRAYFFGTEAVSD